MTNIIWYFLVFLLHIHPKLSKSQELPELIDSDYDSVSDNKNKNTGLPIIKSQKMQLSRFLWQSQLQLEGKIWDMFKDDNHDEGPHPARQYLLRHGCYCFPHAQKTPMPRFGYYGPPVDELDSLCLTLFHAQKCLDLDYKWEGDYCNITLWYPYQLNVDPVTNVNTTHCGKRETSQGNINWNNNHPCQIQNCELEKFFIEQVHSLILSGYEKDWKYRLEDWNYTSICKGNGKPTPEKVMNIKCCGTGFYRRPYDADWYDCCEDGVVRNIGLCDE